MQIFDTWENFQRIPGGRYLFNAFLRKLIPYTGTVAPEVLELRPGFARTRMRDRRLVRNHLNSIHAAALMNFAEATTGLAFVSGIPPDARAILTRFQIEYLKKARGVLTAECTAPRLSSNVRQEFDVSCELKDARGEVVARAQAKWLVGPNERTS